MPLPTTSVPFVPSFECPPITHLECPPITHHPFLRQVSLLSHRLPAQLLWASGTVDKQSPGRGCSRTVPALVGCALLKEGSETGLGRYWRTGEMAPEGATGLAMDVQTLLLKSCI